jgi:GT2 family glycosyltransferase
MKKTELSIITVNFGSKNNVLNLYESIKRNPPSLNWEFIIVDNPTKKGDDGKFLSEYFKEKKNVHVIELAKNIGYGEGNNEGIKFTEGVLIAICNPDIKILKNTFSPLLKEISRDSEIGIAVPVLKTINNKVLENCRKFPTISSLIKRRLSKKSPFTETKIPRKKVIGTEWAQGSFWILKKSVFNDLNGFDSRFFLFMEDIDFCQRIWNKGLKVVQITDSIAIHSPNRLSGGFIFSAIFRKTFWIHLKSAFFYFKKWSSKKKSCTK